MGVYLRTSGEGTWFSFSTCNKLFLCVYVNIISSATLFAACLSLWYINVSLQLANVSSFFLCSLTCTQLTSPHINAMKMNSIETRCDHITTTHSLCCRPYGFYTSHALHGASPCITRGTWFHCAVCKLLIINAHVNIFLRHACSLHTYHHNTSALPSTSSMYFRFCYEQNLPIIAAGASGTRGFHAEID